MPYSSYNMRLPRHTAAHALHGCTVLLATHAAPAAHGGDRICEDYTKGDCSSPGEAGPLLPAAGGSCWLGPLNFMLQLLSFFWPSQLQTWCLLSTDGKRPDAPSHPSCEEKDAKGRSHKPKPDAVNNIPGEEPTAQSSVLLLGEGKNKQTLSTAVTAALPRQDPSFCWSCWRRRSFPKRMRMAPAFTENKARPRGSLLP